MASQAARATGEPEHGSEPTFPEQARRGLDLLLRGFQISRMLRLVADLGVADRIGPNEAIPLEALATACEVRPDRLVRVLRALAAFGVFQVSADELVTHTVFSRLLRKDAPNSMHYSARFWTGPGSWGAWGMLDVAMSGGTPHEAAWNMSRFEYLDEHPDEARTFDAMMANFPDDRHAAVAAAYDFSDAVLIADIGGGNGAALRHILARFPKADGLLFDRPDVIARLSGDELRSSRISAQAGSFFEKVPPGAGIYLLIRVLHDWSDDDCLKILRACRTAMKPDAVLLIGEEILQSDPAHGEPTSYLVDTQMMAMFGHARARTEAEFKSLLQISGFSLRQAIRTASAVSLIEAIPAMADS